MQQRGFTLPILLIFLAIIVFILIIFFKSTKPSILIPKPSPTASENTVTSPEPFISTWKIYTNTQFGFQMSYPKEFKFVNIGAKSAESSASATLGTIEFTDSNKNKFSVNVFPVSFTPVFNTTENNIFEYSGECGNTNTTQTLLNKVFNEGGRSYKQVVQVNAGGTVLTDFCFFAPSGNLLVLKNNTDSTVIAMKQIMESFIFNGQTDKSGNRLYIDQINKFAVRIPKTFTLQNATPDIIPPGNPFEVLINFRRQGLKDEKSSFSQIANFRVSKSSDVTSCLDSLSDITKINGTDYKTTMATLQSPEQSSEYKVFRTIREGCYEVSTSVETINGQSSTAINESQIQADRLNLNTSLASIVNTFTFDLTRE